MSKDLDLGNGVRKLRIGTLHMRKYYNEFIKLKKVGPQFDPMMKVNREKEARMKKVIIMKKKVKMKKIAKN